MEDLSRSSSLESISSKRDPWARTVVLTLDGSGYHVLSTLLMLSRLMKRIRVIEEEEQVPAAKTSADSPFLESSQVAKEYIKLNKQWHSAGYIRSPNLKPASRYLPCHYFDYIASTSTGGLIALMLGRLRMDVDAALEYYLGFMSQLYDLRPRSKMSRVRDRVSFRAVSLQEKEAELKKSLDKFGRKELRSNEVCCKTIVLSFEEKQNGEASPFLFRSYMSPDPVTTTLHSDQAYLKTTLNHSLSEVARATSCSPYYFKPVSIEGRLFYDAGFVLTNPTSIVVHDLMKIATPDQMNDNGKPIGMLVSIGSGYSNPATLQRSSSRIWPSQQSRAKMVRRVNQVLWDTSERVHENVKLKADDFQYFRLNARFDGTPGPFAGFIGQGNSRKLREQIADMTQTYLDTDEAVREINEIARHLVDLRRRRSKLRRWETFAFGWRYRCHECKSEPPPEHVYYDSRGDLMDHLSMVHDYPPLDSQFYDKVKPIIEKGRSNSD